jgi:hypothetical protein
MIQSYSTMIISRFLLADGNLKNNASRGSLRIRKKKAYTLILFLMKKVLIHKTPLIKII